MDDVPFHKYFSRIDCHNCSYTCRTINDWNQLSHDCVNVSSVKMFNYLASAGYT